MPKCLEIYGRAGVSALSSVVSSVQSENEYRENETERAVNIQNSWTSSSLRPRESARKVQCHFEKQYDHNEKL